MTKEDIAMMDKLRKWNDADVEEWRTVTIYLPDPSEGDDATCVELAIMDTVEVQGNGKTLALAGRDAFRKLKEA